MMTSNADNQDDDYGDGLLAHSHHGGNLSVMMVMMMILLMIVRVFLS